MRFLKILGMVVALHVVLFTVFLLSPGCQSNPSSPAPAVSGTDQAPAALPVDDSENWSSQGGSGRPAGATTPPPVNPVSSTISSAPLAAPAGDGVRGTPVRPSNPDAYVSTGDRPPPALNPPPSSHVIRAGDNLAKIAARYGTTVSAIQKANPGIKPQSLRVGQEIKLPAALSSVPTAAETASASSGAQYTVRAGDSLSAIAARNGTTVTALRQANSLRSDTIQVGQQLVIPGGTASAPSGRTAAAPAPAPAPSRTTGTISVDASTASFEHTLKPGDTLGAIAKRYGVTTEQIMAANNISDPRRIRAGQKLLIPGYRGTSPASTAGATGTPAAGASTQPQPAPANPPPADPFPAADTLPEPQPLIPADLGDAPPIPVDEPTPQP